MNRTEHLLSILAEECAEVAQRASKALRFGLEETQGGQPFTNAQRIAIKYAELVAVIEMLIDDGALKRKIADFYPTGFEGLILEKREKVEQFLKYSAKCGTLQL